jgi:hypothetical protein
LPDNVAGLGGYLYIAGTEVFVMITDDSRSVLVDSIPPRMMPRLFLRPQGPPRDIMLIDSGHVRIESGRMVPTGVFAAWKSAGVFHFNTTTLGADISKNLYNVPVLVRFDRTTINFSETTLQGADLRFAKPNGTLFPYQIEVWDPLSGHAAVWLNIDTVYANSSFQHIYYYWGNAAAAPMSDGTIVFDTAQSFRAVWHLQQTGTVEMADATATANVLRSVNMIGSETGPAVIGRGIRLDAARNQHLEAGRVALGIAFTLSAWIAPDSVKPANQIIAALATDSLTQPAFSLHFDANGLLDAVANGTLLDFNAVVPSGWSQVTARYDSTSLSLFVNGAIQGTLSTAPMTIVDTTALLLGSDALDTAHAFSGMFDEITIADVARSDAWIKFTFENQRLGSRIIEFRLVVPGK